MIEHDARQLKSKQDRGEVLLIDVREPHEFSEARIEGALNFPLSTFRPEALPVGGDRQVVFQCGTGKRSATAIEACREAGVPLEQHLKGGLSAWRDAQLPLIAVNPSTGELVRK